MNMKSTLLTIIFITASLTFIPGCASPLSDTQILDSANQYALAHGIHPQDYDISIAPSAPQADQTVPSSERTPNFSGQIKSMSGADTRAVTYAPKNRRNGGAYTFYINKNTGKLVMVMKRK
jgi:hypothetical protein